MKEERLEDVRQDEARRRAVDVLLERGVVFEVERRGPLRLFGKKMRLVINPPTLGVLYAISGEFAAMRVDEDKVEEDPIGYSFSLVRSQSHSMARAVAYAVLGARWKVKCFAGVFSSYLLWQLTAKQLLKLVVTVLSVSGTADFINSIRLIKGTGLLDVKTERPVE